MADQRDYDIALSFAGEDRGYVDQVANLLNDRGVRVFYDLFEVADLWGKDLYVHLSEVYNKRARFTIIFISEAYARKLWTNHERKSAQARAFQDAQEYILPARFDDTEIPGVLPTTGYVSLTGLSPEDFVSLITRKLVSSGGSVPSELVRRDFSMMARAEPLPNSTFAVIIKDDEGRPIKGCQVILQAENGTLNSHITGDNGDVSFELKVRRVSALLVAHPAFSAAIYRMVDPDGAMQVTLPRTDNIGSVAIFGTGYIPGLNGRLNPKLDSSQRTYLYALNIAIDGGKIQPVPFEINVPLELEDNDGIVVFATIKHIAGDLSLLQFTRKPDASAIR